MRFISWNINSIGKRFGELKELVETYKPDFMCLQKVRCDSGREKYVIDGYKPMFGIEDYGDNSRVMIFVKVNEDMPSLLQWETLPKRVATPELSQNGHLQVYESEKFFLVNAYVPFSNEKIEGAEEYRRQWDGAFRVLIKELTQSKPVIICGDLNIVHTVKDTCEEKLEQKRGCFWAWERENFNQLLKEADLVDSFREHHPDLEKPTFYGNFRFLGIGNRIDYFLISRSLLSKTVESDILTDFGTGQSVPLLLDIDL